MDRTKTKVDSDCAHTMARHMAIPNWLWPTDGGDGSSKPGSDMGQLPSTSDIESTSDLFGTLSNQIRLEMLTVLYDCSAPISYTALRDEMSIDDKGRFNYHLRQLGPLVRSQDGQYTLTADGEALLEAVFADREMR